MVFFKLDDFSGSCECLMFSKVFATCENLIVLESTILVTGKLESSGDAVKLHVDEAISLDDAKQKLTKRIGIIIDKNTNQSNRVTEIKKLIEENEGTMPVLICLKDNGIIREFHINYKISFNSEFIPKVKKLLGEESIVYLAT